MQHLQRSSVGAEFEESAESTAESTERRESGAIELDAEASQDLEQTGTTGQASYHEILQQAAGVGALHAVHHLLQRHDVHGAHESAACARTPLHAACMNGRAEVVRVLLEARASATSSDRNGVQPLHLAAQGGSEQVLTLLTTARAKMDATSGQKQTALHWAARSGAPGAVLSFLLADHEASAASAPRKARGARAGACVRVDAMSSACCHSFLHVQLGLDCRMS